MKTGWLVVNGFLRGGKFDEPARLFCEAADRYPIRLQVRKNSECLVALTEKDHGGDTPDFVIFQDKDILLAEHLEARGIPVYNSSHSIALCDDKRRTHLALYRAGLPMPQTIFSPMTYDNTGYSDLAFLNRVEELLPYPMIVKEACGSFGEQVYLARGREQLEQIIRDAGSLALIFQQFIASSTGRDIRLQVVGGHVIGAMYRHSESDFRANITAGGQMRAYIPSEEEKNLAVRAAAAVGCDFAGVDLLFGEDGPLVCEVNSNAHFKNLMECSGVNTAEEILDHIGAREGWKQ